MSPLHIRAPGKSERSDKWRKWGVTGNPFPASAVAHPDPYDGHILPDDLESLNSWLSGAVSETTDDNRSRRPLAMKGSIGVGKTHWLHEAERAIRSYREEAHLEKQIIVSYHALTDVGMKTLSLGGLMKEGLEGSDILRDTLIACGEVTDDDFDLPSATPLRVPLQRLARARGGDRQEISQAFEAWLFRRHVSPSMLGRLGASGRLESEGQWVRALAHFTRVMQKLSGFRAWIVLLDQLEDLWRRDVTTPLRRARFLTELRSLIDEAYAGAPISVAMAWNTAVAAEASRKGIPTDVEDQLRKDYIALFTRIHQDRVIEIPELSTEHLLPFAETFVRAAAQDGHEPALVRHLPTALAAYGGAKNGRVTARDWLGWLRQWAEALPDSVPIRRIR